MIVCSVGRGCQPSSVRALPLSTSHQATGLVARQPHPADGRKRTLALTRRGRELWETLSTRLHSSGLFADLDAEEQRTLLALLTKVRLPHRP